jgi:hypothetical protein
MVISLCRKKQTSEVLKLRMSAFQSVLFMIARQLKAAWATEWFPQP